MTDKITNLQRLVIGYIPENCKSEYITPFNPDQSETVETCI